MSQEMASQPSEDLDLEPNPRSDDEMDDDEDINHYYNIGDEEHDSDRLKEDDPEYFEYQLLNVEDVERLLNENVEALSQCIKVSRSDRILIGMVFMFINNCSQI